MSSGSPEFKARYKGHSHALTSAKLAVDRNLQVDAISTEETDFQAAMQLIEKGKLFNAICCASDLIAVSAMRALKASDIIVPEQVAVVGFDDIPMASFTSPALTTAKQNTVLAGELLVDKLLQIINGEKAETELMPTSLVVRQSSMR